MNPTNLDHTQLLKAQAHIWNTILSFYNFMSLKCTIDLGILDAIHNQGGNPMTTSQLATTLAINEAKAPCLDRLMRILTHSGFFERKEQGYVLTHTSLLLLNDHPLSLAPFVKVIVDPEYIKPSDSLGSWFRNHDPSAFYTAHGRAYWDYASNNANFNNLFNEAMASDSQMVSRIITDVKYKWIFEGLSSLVDVGGGTGVLTKAISEAFPDMECVVFDLPHVVAGIDGGKNLKYEGGSMFDGVPPADGLLLKWILHDWNDKECVEILKKCKEAILEKNGKVIIIDMVIMNNNNVDKDYVETQLLMDIHMMTLFCGKERDEENWAKLFYDAGFSGYKISPIFGDAERMKNHGSTYCEIATTPRTFERSSVWMPIFSRKMDLIGSRITQQKGI